MWYCADYEALDDIKFEKEMYLTSLHDNILNRSPRGLCVPPFQQFDSIMLLKESGF